MHLSPLSEVTRNTSGCTLAACIVETLKLWQSALHTATALHNTQTRHSTPPCNCKSANFSTPLTPLVRRPNCTVIDKNALAWPALLVLLADGCLLRARAPGSFSPQPNFRLDPKASCAPLSATVHFFLRALSSWQRKEFGRLHCVLIPSTFKGGLAAPFRCLPPCVELSLHLVSPPPQQPFNLTSTSTSAIYDRQSLRERVSAVGTRISEDLER